MASTVGKPSALFLEDGRVAIDNIQLSAPSTDWNRKKERLVCRGRHVAEH